MACHPPELDGQLSLGRGMLACVQSQRYAVIFWTALSWLVCSSPDGDLVRRKLNLLPTRAAQPGPSESHDLAVGRVSIVLEHFIRMLQGCGLPAEDCDMIHGNGKVVNELLVQARPRSTLFTGSQKIAEKLAMDLKGKVGMGFLHVELCIVIWN